MDTRTDASAGAVCEVVALIGVGDVDVVCGGQRAVEIAGRVEGVGVGEDGGVAVDGPGVGWLGGKCMGVGGTYHQFRTATEPLGMKCPLYQSSSLVACVMPNLFTGRQRSTSFTMART